MKLEHFRFGKFYCWLMTGHIWNKTFTKKPMSREMNQCIYCKKVIAGPD